MAMRCVQLNRWCWEVWIGEVPYRDSHVRAPFESPENSGATRRTEVVTDLVSDGTSEAVDFHAVIDLGFARDRYLLIFRKDGADLKDTPCSPLTEFTVADRYCQWFALHGDLELSAGAFGRSHHGSTIAQP